MFNIFKKYKVILISIYNMLSECYALHKKLYFLWRNTDADTKQKESLINWFHDLASLINPNPFYLLFFKKRNNHLSYILCNFTHLSIPLKQIFYQQYAHSSQTDFASKNETKHNLNLNGLQISLLEIQDRKYHPVLNDT